ncbi:MAG: hypothetical protein Q8934_13820 [Bacillota bacterium]|nr:hypothetical protein [Bacillota bacterium]
MQSLQDTLYNWLTIKVVSDARPDDSAARETTDLFEEMLTNEHGVTELEIIKNAPMYDVFYLHEGEKKKKRFPMELADFMLNQINEKPEWFENYPIEEDQEKE